MAGKAHSDLPARPIEVLRGTEEDLRAMKRALANAQLGPTAVLALSSAIIALETGEDEAR